MVSNNIADESLVFFLFFSYVAKFTSEITETNSKTRDFTSKPSTCSRDILIFYYFINCPNIVKYKNNEFKN